MFALRITMSLQTLISVDIVALAEMSLNVGALTFLIGKSNRKGFRELE